MCSFWDDEGSAALSSAYPVSRGGFPNSSRNGVVTLPSGRSTEAVESGIVVYGSGVVLE